MDYASIRAYPPVGVRRHAIHVAAETGNFGMLLIHTVFIVLFSTPELSIVTPYNAPCLIRALLDD